VYFVYILYSPSTNSFYKGQTSDLDERLQRHNGKFEKATSYGAPWTLIWRVGKDTRGEALVLEKKLKNMSKEKLITFINKYIEGVEGPDASILRNYGRDADRSVSIRDPSATRKSE
jgi:putative endonuclease